MKDELNRTIDGIPKDVIKNGNTETTYDEICKNPKATSMERETALLFEYKTSLVNNQKKDEIIRRITNDVVMQGSILEAIDNILNDEPVSDFMLSFPVVQQVYDLKKEAK